MKISNKIIYDQIQELSPVINEIKKQKKKIVLCIGHFNVIHPGHLRFIEFAKKQGDYLVVAVQGESKIDVRVKDKFFNEEQRAKGVASLEYVDKVFVFNKTELKDIVGIIKPNIYVKGEEFSKKRNEIKEEVDLVEKNGGKIVFSSGDSNHFDTELLDEDLVDIQKKRRILFKEALEKQDITVQNLLDCCDQFSKKRILVIGDTIVDQYIACDALGMSSEAPVLVVKELEHKKYIGGAGIVARHVKALGAKCTFVSIIGQDTTGELVTRELSDDGIDTKLIVDLGRPTTLKKRYMVGSQKILRVSRLKDVHIDQTTEEKITSYIDSISDELDGIVITDFGYGIITQNILSYISKISKQKNIKLFGDVQSSSQIGNVLKFNGYYMLKPNEKEARIALDDKYSGLEVLGTNLINKTNSNNLVLTLAGHGFISFGKTDDEYFIRTQHFPALNPTPIDVMGAGDSMIAGLSVSSCSGASLMQASAISAIIAGIVVSKMGNVPIKLEEVKSYIKSL